MRNSRVPLLACPAVQRRSKLCYGIEKNELCPFFSPDEICTSHCERLNGTIRNYTKRMCRLTYAFSKKWENHQASLALFFMAYNYAKPHKSLKKRTPAMAHGLADHVWSVRELLVEVSGS